MYTITLALILVTIFLWFNTSKKVKFSSRPIWLEKLVVNKKRTQTLASSLALLTLLITMNLQGGGAGIFAWLVYSMGLMSLVVLLYPYQYIKYHHIILIFVLFLFVELFSSYILTH